MATTLPLLQPQSGAAAGGAAGGAAGEAAGGAAGGSNVSPSSGLDTLNPPRSLACCSSLEQFQENFETFAPMLKGISFGA